MTKRYRDNIQIKFNGTARNGTARKLTTPTATTRHILHHNHNFASSMRFLFILLQVLGATSTPSSMSSKNPSNDSSKHPTNRPSTIQPTRNPTAPPFDSPSSSPTEMSTLLPSTKVPSPTPSQKATTSPSKLPSTSLITTSHTTSPIFQFQSLNPSSTATSASSSKINLITTIDSPTLQPISLLSVTPKISGISLTLSGIDPLDGEGERRLEKLTALHIENFFNNECDGVLFDVEVEIEVTKIEPPFVEKVNDGGGGEDGGRKMDDNAVDGGGVGKENDGNKDSKGNRKRTLLLRTTPQRQQRKAQQLRNGRQNLEDKMLTITYSQTMTYRVQNDASPDLSDLQFIVREPFNNISKRSMYVESLKDGGGGSFDALKLATWPTIHEEVVVPEAVDQEIVVYDRQNMQVILVLISAVLGVLFVLGIICFKWGKDGIKFKSPILPEVTDTDTFSTDPHAGFVPQKSMAQFPDQQQSVGTIDHDYQFTGPGTVSSAGGTLGDTTNKSNITGNQSINTNDVSFVAQFLPTKPIRREDVFDVIVPPGKVGVLFDTRDSGAPVIHSFREYCLISDRLVVGDRIIAVDDEDVKAMTAVAVGILINQKSANRTRKFTILRNSTT